MRMCAQCGVAISDTRDARMRYCSDRCGQTARRRARGVKPFVPGVVDGQKQCNMCGEWKPIGEYSPRKNRNGKPNSYCRPCRAERTRAYLLTEHGRNVHYAQKYVGVTVKWYEDKLSEQGGACAICLRTDKPLHIDHCHTSGSVRGLLCFECNIGLGKFRDNIASLERAIQYLKR